MEPPGSRTRLLDNLVSTKSNTELKAHLSMGAFNLGRRLEFLPVLSLPPLCLVHFYQRRLLPAQPPDASHSSFSMKQKGNKKQEKEKTCCLMREI